MSVLADYLSSTIDSKLTEPYRASTSGTYSLHRSSQIKKPSRSCFPGFRRGKRLHRSRQINKLSSPHNLYSLSVDLNDIELTAIESDIYRQVAQIEFETHRVLETLWGKVDYQTPEFCGVSFESKTTGKHFLAKCSAKQLHAAGISKGDYFKCEVIENGASTRLSYTKTSPKALNDDDLKNILEIAKDLCESIE